MSQVGANLVGCCYLLLTCLYDASAGKVLRCSQQGEPFANDLKLPALL